MATYSQPWQNEARQNGAQPFTLGNTVDSFRRVAETHQMVTGVLDEATDLIKKHYKNPDDLALWLEGQGVPVYVVDGPEWLINLLLRLFGYAPGFVPPDKTKYYPMLVDAMQRRDEKRHCTFDYGMFVFTRSQFRVGFIAHQVYHWLSFRSGLPGYQPADQKRYREFWEKNRGELGPEVHEMTAEETISLKNAINRDLEALLFIRQAMQQIFIPGHQAGKIREGSVSA